MGLSYLNCAISGQIIQENEMAYIIVLERVDSEMARIMKRNWYQALGLPILGKYDDYCFVESKEIKKHLITINNVNKRVPSDYQVSESDENLNNIWSAIIDDRFQTKKSNLTYTIISKKSVDAIIKTYKNIFPKQKFLQEVQKAQKSMSSGNDLKNDITKNLKVDSKTASEIKKMNSFFNKNPLFWIDSESLKMLSDREFNWIEKNTLVSIIKDTDSHEDLYTFFLITKMLDKMGRAFTTPQYGTQTMSNALINNFYKNLIKGLK